MARIVVVDDEKSVLEMIRRALEKSATSIHTFQSARDALAAISQINPDIVITDIRMASCDGFEVLRLVKKYDTDINVILITAYASIDTAVEALRAGAFDYLIKPFKIKDLRLAVTRALSTKKIIGKEIAAEKKEIIGETDIIRTVNALIERVSPTDSTVLINGESGTGKELVARAIHAHSPRAKKPFVSINCAALPDTLLESELFGFEKGSFTGALTSKVGLIEYADGGSVFLDEIGEISLAVQSKLLRVLQEREIKRVGGLTDIAVDVRIIAATSRDLEDEIKNKRFRDDLYYRINVVPITMPPLRERKGDIALLAEHFLSVCNKKMGRRCTFLPQALSLLQSYTWPGNVRELENTIERVIALAEEENIGPDIIRRYWGKEKNEYQKIDGLPLSCKKKTSSLTKDLIVQALDECQGKRTEVAKKLNISKQNLQYYIKKFHIPLSGS